MADEIERKFLVDSEEWRDTYTDILFIQQGYLLNKDDVIVRVRAQNQSAWVAVKTATKGISRKEYELEIPLGEVFDLLALCSNVLEKHRYIVPYEKHVWEIDVFEGANSGLIVAEIELKDPKEYYALPPWVGLEVSHDARYYNSCLSKHPYNTWKHK